MRDPGPSERTSTWAVASAVVGVAGVAVAATEAPLPILPSIVAIVLAQKARRDLRRPPRTLRGAGLARLGWWLGVLGICVRVVIAIVVEADAPMLLLVFAGAAAVGVVFRAAGRASERRAGPPGT